jgi:hypothetical protein
MRLKAITSKATGGQAGLKWPDRGTEEIDGEDKS